MDDNFIKQALAAYFDDKPLRSYEVMSYGRENTSVKIQAGESELILRIWGELHSAMGKRLQSDIDGELAFAANCYAHGVPVPKIYKSKRGNLHEKLPDGREYVIMDYVGGDVPSNFSADMVGQVATTMAKMHILSNEFTFPAPRSWPGTFTEVIDQRIRKLATLVPSLETQTASLLTREIETYNDRLAAVDLSPLPIGVIHGDIMWENMKFVDGKLAGIFDFDDCRTSYYLEDIAKTLSFDFEDSDHGIFGGQGEHVATFLQAYDKVRQRTTEEIQLLPLFMLARFLYQAARCAEKIKTGDASAQPKLNAMVESYQRNQTFFRT